MLTRPRNALLIALFVGQFLTGCALLPEEGKRAEPMAMPDLERTLQPDPEAEKMAREWPRSQWWRDFHNAELNRLVETGLKDSPTLGAVSARLSQAQAVADFQAAEMLPSVGASASFTHQRFSASDFYGPNGGKTFTGAYIDPVVFRYHLDLWGKDRAALESALGKESAQAAELAVARLLLGTTLARGYFRLSSAEEEIELAEALVANAGEKLRLTRLRRERGLDTQDPVHAAEQQLEAARQREAGLRAEAKILRHRLAALAGQGPDWGETIRVSASGFAGQFPLPEKLPLGLLAHRPDVAAALWRVEAAKQQEKVARTEFYPDINLVGFAGLRSINLKDLFMSHGASLAYSVGPTLTLPLFEGGRLEAALKHRQAEYDGAVAGYNAALLGAVQQVADALALWRESHAQDAAQARALEAAEAEMHLAERRFGAGLSTLDGRLVANATLIEQRLKQSALRAEHLQAAVGLIEALGGGYESHTHTSSTR